MTPKAWDRGKSIKGAPYTDQVAKRYRRHYSEFERSQGANNHKKKTGARQTVAKTRTDRAGHRRQRERGKVSGVLPARLLSGVIGGTKNPKSFASSKRIVVWPVRVCQGGRASLLRAIPPSNGERGSV